MKTLLRRLVWALNWINGTEESAPSAPRASGLHPLDFLQVQRPMVRWDDEYVAVSGIYETAGLRPRRR